MSDTASARAFSAAESGLTQARNDMQAFVETAPQNGQWTATDGAVVAGIMGVASEKSYTVSVSGQSMTFAYSITYF